MYQKIRDYYKIGHNNRSVTLQENSHKIIRIRSAKNESARKQFHAKYNIIFNIFYFLFNHFILENFYIQKSTLLKHLYLKSIIFGILDAKQL